MEKEKLIDSIVDSLGDALKEDVEDIDEMLEQKEQPDEAQEETSDSVASETSELGSRKVRSVFVSVAVIMLFFSVIGVIVSVGFVRDRVIDIRDRRALKDEFALFIYPVVINDPPAYDSVDNLQPSTIINSAIWKIILTGDKSNYETDMGVMYIPAADVELSANSLFGAVRFEHESVSARGIEFIFSAQNNNYEVPENPMLFSYSPLITSITNVGETYTVTVDYMMPSPIAIAGIEHDNEPIKTMIYTISRTRERMTIDSIQHADLIDRGDL